MAAGTLLIKLLVAATLLLGLLSLAANLAYARRKHGNSSGGSDGVRGSDPVVATLLAARGSGNAANGSTPVRRSKEEWKDRLTAEQYQVARCGVTERPFSGEFWDFHDEGTYHCIGCHQPLFDSAAKFESDTGWPSYRQPIAPRAVRGIKDISFGMVRTAIQCRCCESHLGHVFADGPEPTGLRYCINSASLHFQPAAGTEHRRAGNQ